MTTNNSANANSTTPLAVIDGGTGVSAPTQYGVAIGEGTSPINSITLSAGQILIGTTSGDPVPGTLTAGTGISITSASGSITVTNTMPVSLWTITSTTAVSMVANTAYLNTYTAGLCTFTLPTTAAYGTMLGLTTGAASSAQWSIAQNAGQHIRLGNQVTTTGTGGSITSEYGLLGSNVYLQCIIANTAWQVVYSVGNLTIV